MQATAGLAAKHPDRIFDAPLNEPLIMGTACGAGLHKDLVVMPEVQFGDYCLNAFHWFVHMGNLYWSTQGTPTSLSSCAHQLILLVVVRCITR